MGVSGLVACGSFATPNVDSREPSVEASVDASASPNEAGPSDATVPVEPGPDVDAAPRQFRVFVTADTTPGQFANGTDDADALCAVSAGTALPGRRWKAYLALPNMLPRTRIVQVPGGWFDTKGNLVADSPARLDAPLDNPPELDASGKSVSGKAWTGMRDGAPRNTCDAWRRSGQGEFGDIGDGVKWFASGADNGCDTGNHLYCFEQP